MELNMESTAYKKIGEEKQTAHSLLELIKIARWPKLALAWSIVFTLISAAFSLVLPIITGKLVDKISAMELTIQTAAVLISLFLAGGILNAVSSLLLRYVGSKFFQELRLKIWEKIIHLPVNYFDNNENGKIISRMTNDLAIVSNFLAITLPSILADVLMVTGCIIMLFVLDWRLMSVLVALIPITALLIYPIGRRMNRVAIEAQDAAADFSGELSKILYNIRFIKATTSEKLEMKYTREILGRIFRLNIKEGILSAVIEPIVTIIIMLALVGMFWYGSAGIAAGHITTGTLVSMIFYLFTMVSPLTQLSSFFSQYQKAKGASKEIYTIYNQQDEKQEKLGSVPDMKSHDQNSDILHFANVSFSYNQGQPVLSNVELTFRGGTTTAIVGPSGSGKTTIFSLIEKFYSEYNGEIYYNNVYLDKIRTEEWRRKISYVMQDSDLLVGSVRDNLVYGLNRDADDHEIYAALDTVGLKEVIYQLPDGLDTFVGERGVKLSGGQKQRIQIARCLLSDHEILLFDEATANLDSESEQLVHDVIKLLSKNKMTIVIAHRLSTIYKADQIIFLDKGEVTGVGTHHELMSWHDKYRDYVQFQLPTQLS
ncbi:ABC transporter ATP-binding protein [Paenibacillus sp. FSL M8-0228]|jgi:ATP-binding cassette subfamily B protein AbcA/BmrA|uniref:ABC transporter ATP-binding protein n=1 Tax=Paenibacillus TaxID=44249 RepID=UPI0009C06CF6|nr:MULTISPECIES: ABC transporter ATP-binding protein [Paenibacillus]MBE3650589.1 ABC transporter ATP-binding protein [Paenibacillus polymyxa]MBO3283341.1 ABC transporter ATP-binding protein [Paenibacillus polymyxa]MDY8095058.1 ABC transporter ATP-binding protein [Paenibacillus polymyxa]PNQ84843.1 ABC transporter ATP-binding protein [Paenibacillus polymyxa]PTU44877.1 ABC transporter ATP-binding protein [Paenibacillus polymyxa]